jgi:hypothetical protein
MTTYTAHQQRQLDEDTGAALDAVAARARLLTATRQACAEMRGGRLCGCTLANCCRSARRIATGESTVEQEHERCRSNP